MSTKTLTTWQGGADSEPNTYCTSQQGVMGVCAVKNRYGPADATGGTPIWLSYEPASMQITDLTQHQVQIGQQQLL